MESWSFLPLHVLQILTLSVGTFPSELRSIPVHSCKLCIFENDVKDLNMVVAQSEEHWHVKREVAG